MIELKRLCVLLAASGPLFTDAVCRAADQYPNRPIRMIVGFAPGGSLDLIARILAKHLTESFDKTVLVDNRPGANGIIGTEITAKSLPDGYTLMLVDAPHAINPFVYPNAKYDPVGDFAPISLVASAPVVLAVNPKVAAQSIRDFVANAKAQPGRITMASGGSGGISHVGGELFQLKAGIKLNHIPYKGSGPALADVVAGQSDSIFSPAPAAAPLIRGGKLRALAVSSRRRSPAIPDAPTFDEAGFTDFYVSNWYGLLAPAGTPQDIVALLNRDVVAAVRSPGVKERFDSALLEPATNSPQEFVAFLQAEAARWSQLIRTLGIKAQ